MARVTVEDCIDKVDNRFDLVLLAAHRARMISSGSQLTVDRDNDKNPVVSLREIAELLDLPGRPPRGTGSFPAKVRRGRRTRARYRAADRFGRCQRRCRRHRGRSGAHDRGRAPEGSRRPGASGRAARRGGVSSPTGRPQPPDLSKARTFARAFAFVDIFAVTMRAWRIGSKSAETGLAASLATGSALRLAQAMRN